MSGMGKFLRRMFKDQTAPESGLKDARATVPLHHSNQVFDRYVSLGCNCEVGFQLKRVLGAAESGFFTWNITEPDALISLLKNDFVGILRKENLSLHTGGHLVHDKPHDFMVHHLFDPVHFKSAPDFDDKLQTLSEKFDYFVRKFREEAASPGRTAYFYKNVHSDARGFALQVHALLKRYHGTNPFTLIILQPAENMVPDWGLPGIRNRYLKRFAPYDDTPDGHVPSWDAVFREFPHRKPLLLANY